MIGGRRTGKTWAALIRAIHNKKETVFVSCKAASLSGSIQREFATVTEHLDMEYEILSNRSGILEIYCNNKTIYFLDEYAYQRHSGFDLCRGKEVIFEEPEHMQSIVRELNNEGALQHLLLISDVVMIGGLAGPGRSAFKGFYRYCQRNDTLAKRITPFDLPLDEQMLNEVQRQMSHERFMVEVMCEWSERGVEPYAYSPAV
jgi:hypothetical protein